VKFNKYSLGELIEQINRRNSDLEYGVEDVMGVSNNKVLMETKASPEYADLSKFYILKPGEFVYNPRTSRNGEKVGMAYNNTDHNILFTFNNIPFRIKPECRDILDADYLYLYFLNPTFDKYARYNSWGSATELFSWEEMCRIVINLPLIDEQRRIVHDYQVITKRIIILKKLNASLVETCMNLFKKYTDSEKIVWSEGKLKDLLFLTKNAIKSDDVGNMPYLPIDAIPSNELFIDEFRPSEDAQSSLISFEKDDILIGAMRVYFHRVAIAPCKGVTRTTCFVLRPYNKKYLYYALLLCNQNATIDYANSTSQGSTMPYAVWENGLEDMPIKYPSDKTLDVFNETIARVFDSIYINTQEITKLKALLECIKVK